MSVEYIPEEMRALPNWICWKAEERDGLLTKVPYRADGQGYAKSNDPTTWATHDAASAAAIKYQGIGFQAGLEPSGIILLDLDHCIFDGEPESWAKEILGIANSHTEISPSGEGYHVFFRGVLPGPGMNCGGAEIYDRTRYFTVTGRRDPIFVAPFRELSNEETSKIYQLVFARKPTKAKSVPPFLVPQAPKESSDILQKMFSARNGTDIQSLYNGDTSAYKGDESSADLALCCHFAFYAKKDPVEMDRLFRSSVLMREKWDRKHSGDGRTYGQMTIDKAIAGCTKVYGEENIQRQEQIEHTISGEVLEESKSKKCSVTIPSDCLSKINNLYFHGHEKGYELEWMSMKKLMRIVPGWLHIFTGFPGDGKTEFMLDIAMRLAVSKKLRWAIFSPENYPVEDILSNLLEKVIKKNFFGQGRMSWLEVEREIRETITDRIIILGEKDESVSLENILNTVRDLEIDGLIIDPYNELESARPSAMSNTEFIGYNLIRLRRFAKMYNKIAFISAHPSKPKPNDKGELFVPTLYSIADSAHWKNKADFGICVYRNEETKLTDIHISKVRSKYNGEKGIASLVFDKVTGTFSDNQDNF